MHPTDYSEKDDKWYLEWQKYIWGLYTTNKLGIGEGGIAPCGRPISVLRAFARGMQGASRYQDVLDPVDKDTKKRLNNISWETYKLLPKFRDIARERIINTPFGIQTTAIDALAVQERDKQMGRMKAKLHPNFKQAAMTAGLEAGVPGLNQPSDVDTLNQIGGIALDVEIFLKDCLDESEYGSSMDVLKAMIVDDIIDNNVCALEAYHDKSLKRVRYRYVDPDRLLYRHSIYPDCRDIDLQGYWEEKTIAQIRQESGLSEDKLQDILRKKKYTGGYQSTGRGAFYRSYQYDNFKVPVLTSYWIAKEAEDFLVGNHSKYGTQVYKPIDKMVGGKQRRDREVVTHEYQCVYTCKWVIDTEYVYDCGMQEGIVRDGANGNKVAKLPIAIYQSDTPSFIERCIAIVDQINLEWFGIQTFLLKLPPAPRVWWDEALLETVLSVNGKKRDMAELIEKYQKTGVGVFRSKPEFDSGVNGSNRVPMVPISYDFAQELTVRLNYIESLKNQIRDMTGINEIADGSTQNEKMLKGVMEGLDAATNMALSPYMRAYMNVYENASRYAARKWMMGVRSGNISTSFLTKRVSKRVAESEGCPEHDMGVRVVSLPTQKDKDFLLQNLFLKQQNGMLGEQDYFMLYEMIKDGDIRKAQWYSAMAVERKMQADHEKQLELIEAQGRQTQATGQAVEQEKQKTKSMELQAKGSEINFEAQADAQSMAQEHKYKMQEIAFEKTLEGQNLQKTH